MIENTVTVTANVDPASAYSFLTDTARWREWMESLESASINGDFAAGSEIEVIYTEGAGATMEIVQAAEPTGYSYRVTMTDMSIAGNTTLTRVDGGTRITYEESVEPQSFMIKLMKPFIANGIRRALEKDYQKAKELMEATHD